MNTPMNTPLNTRIARRAASVAASLLITFTGVNLIANYALPEPSKADAVLLAGASGTTKR